MRCLIPVGILSSFIAISAWGNCVYALRNSVQAHSVRRNTYRDVKVESINPAWTYRYRSGDFRSYIPSVQARIPFRLKAKVEALLLKLDRFAAEGQLKNLNDWVAEAVRSDDVSILPHICEAEYAIFLMEHNPNYVITFEPSTGPNKGFYRGNDEQISRLGMRQKSIDLRISDRLTGKVIALREVKSSAFRANPQKNLQDAFEKVQLLHHLAVPELMTDTSVEVGLVYFYDFDPTAEFMNPVTNYSFPRLRKAVETYLNEIQRFHQLGEKPFDAVTLLDFGSRRFFIIKRLADDTLEIADHPLDSAAFTVFTPKVGILEAAEIRAETRN